LAVKNAAVAAARVLLRQPLRDGPRGTLALDLRSIGASGLAAAAIRAELRAPWGLPSPRAHPPRFFVPKMPVEIILL